MISFFFFSFPEYISKSFSWVRNYLIWVRLLEVKVEAFLGTFFATNIKLRGGGRKVPRREVAFGLSELCFLWAGDFFFSPLQQLAFLSKISLWARIIRMKWILRDVTLWWDGQIDSLSQGQEISVACQSKVIHLFLHIDVWFIKWNMDAVTDRDHIQFAA